MKTPSIIQIIIMSSLFFVMGCEQDNEIVKSLSKETLSHEFIQIKEEAQLSEWLEEMALTASNARVTAVLDDISFEESIKRTDSLGNVMYALHMKSANQLSLKNLWLYEIGGKIEGRIIQYDLDRSWLRLNGFNGWDSYTGYFSVYTLDNELLYETKIVEGSSVSPASNVRSHGLVCTTITDKICVSVPHMPELGEDCYYDTKTSCTWYTPRPETSGVFTGAVIDPIPIADYERAASCAYNERYNDYTKQCEPRCGANEVYSTIHGCVDRCDRGEIRNENGECVSEAEAWEEEICQEDAFKNNDCVQDIWNKMKRNDVAYDAIKRYLNDDDKLNLCLDIKSLNTDDKNINGNAQPTVTFSNDQPISLSVTINLNSKRLNRSKLSIARTLIHEMYHAQLMEIIFQAGQFEDYQNHAANYQEQDDFLTLWNYYQETGITNIGNADFHHEYMAQNYIDDIASGLKILHSELSSQGFIDYVEGYPFSLTGFNENINWNWNDFLTALAWSGLEGTEAWEDLSPRTRQLYEQYAEYENYETNKCK